MLQQVSHLDNIDAGIQKDAAFGLLGGLFILVGIQDVGAVRQLRQVEISSLEHLQRQDQPLDLPAAAARGEPTPSFTGPVGPSG